jgi:hypothetical protein
MAADDYYTHLARQQLQRLDANKAQTLADLAAAKANSDYETAGSAVQELADIESKRTNLLNLHSQYVRSQTPVEAPELTGGTSRQAVGSHGLERCFGDDAQLEIRR